MQMRMGIADVYAHVQYARSNRWELFVRSGYQNFDFQILNP